MILFFCFVQAGKHVAFTMIQHSSSMFVIQEMMVLLLMLLLFRFVLLTLLLAMLLLAMLEARWTIKCSK